MYGDWISVKDRLPEDGQEVIVYEGGVLVARFRRGISKADRERMKRGEMDDPIVTGWNLTDGYTEYRRSDAHRATDEGDNNLVPYCWDMVRGEGRLFGQYVKFWMPLPDAPNVDAD